MKETLEYGYGIRFFYNNMFIASFRNYQTTPMEIEIKEEYGYIEFTHNTEDTTVSFYGDKYIIVDLRGNEVSRYEMTPDEENHEFMEERNYERI